MGVPGGGAAEWLADAADLSRQNANEAALDRSLKTYARVFRTNLAGHGFIVCSYSTGRDYNFIDKLKYPASARDSVYADHLLTSGERCIGVGKFLSPNALARADGVNLRHTLSASRAP